MDSRDAMDPIFAGLLAKNVMVGGAFQYTFLCRLGRPQWSETEEKTGLNDFLQLLSNVILSVRFWRQIDCINAQCIFQNRIGILDHAF